MYINNPIIPSCRNNILVDISDILERESAFRRVGLFNFSVSFSLPFFLLQKDNRFPLSCFFFHGTKGVFNKSDYARSPRGKADAAHYQCPSLTAISYHPCWIIPSVALRELRVSFDQEGGCFIIEYLNRVEIIFTCIGK